MAATLRSAVTTVSSISVKSRPHIQDEQIAPTRKSVKNRSDLLKESRESKTITQTITAKTSRNQAKQTPTHRMSLKGSLERGVVQNFTGCKRQKFLCLVWERI